MVRCEARRAEEVPLGCGGDLREGPGAPVTHRTRRGIGGEAAWMLAWAGPSEAEGPEGGAEARRCPRAGKRSRYFAVHQRGFLGAAAPKRPFRPFWAVPKGPRAGARNLPWQGCARNTPRPEARNLPRQALPQQPNRPLTRPQKSDTVPTLQAVKGRSTPFGPAQERGLTVQVPAGGGGKAPGSRGGEILRRLVRVIGQRVCPGDPGQIQVEPRIV